MMRAGFLFLGLLLAAPAAAQTVRVTVADAASGAPVAGAMVRVESDSGALAAAGFSDARGTVQLRLPEGGLYTVGATRAGYAPGAQPVDVASAGRTDAVLRLAVRPLTLDTVKVVRTETGEREVGRQSFERRRAAADGIYLDSAYVARRSATWPGDLLYSVPGIEVRGVPGPRGIRRPATRLGGRCLSYLVNGLPFYGGWPRWVALEETLRRSDVVAVEVYPIYDRVPMELRRYAAERGYCGLIVYWTEDGWNSTSRGADPDAG
ncbi:MAG TPA: carboxypeptidase-like regulatory domain-containing protein [Longimicrobium sp.]|jgi:hypothetical protein|uniref:carboxypeptidase-like regulatory domain-containing protein n=1 Tax=Longimicrobium sp. TaxID=2029185 RepID=UPI002EDA5F67